MLIYMRILREPLFHLHQKWFTAQPIRKTTT